MPERKVLDDWRVMSWVELVSVLVAEERMIGGSDGMRPGEFDHSRTMVSVRE